MVCCSTLEVCPKWCTVLCKRCVEDGVLCYVWDECKRVCWMLHVLAASKQNIFSDSSCVF